MNSNYLRRCKELVACLRGAFLLFGFCGSFTVGLRPPLGALFQRLGMAAAGLTFTSACRRGLCLRQCLDLLTLFAPDITD